MPLFRCDFRVVGDLVFANEKKVARIVVGESATFTYRNEAPTGDGHSHALIASVVGEAESMESAESILRRRLADQLNLLAFALQARFRIDRALRLIEWTPFQKSRRLTIFHTVDPRSPPLPELTVEHIATVMELERASPQPAIRKAMRYFRFGMMNQGHEDQFFNLWLALEIVAESAPKKQVAITCRKCKGELVCAACSEAAMRMPGGRHAIEPFIRRFSSPGEAEVTVRRLLEARNKLLHGSSAESIAAECGRPLPQIVNELGDIAWRSILSTILFRPDGSALSFGHWGGEFASMMTITAMKLAFDHTGPEEHPPDDKIPSADISLTTTFGKRPGQDAS